MLFVRTSQFTLQMHTLLFSASQAIWFKLIHELLGVEMRCLPVCMRIVFFTGDKFLSPIILCRGTVRELLGQVSSQCSSCCSDVTKIYKVAFMWGFHHYDTVLEKKDTHNAGFILDFFFFFTEINLYNTDDCKTNYSALLLLKEKPHYCPITISLYWYLASCLNHEYITFQNFALLSCSPL